MKLIKVDVKVNVQPVVPVDIYPTDKAVDDHLLCFNAWDIGQIDSIVRQGYHLRGT